MSADVIPLHVVEAGDGHVIAPDQVLSEAAGKYFRLVVVGEAEDGEIHVCGSHGAPDSLMLLAWAQQFIVSNRVAR